jgi:DNA invertase Pin-like site-specific DNA recombinase
MTKKGRVARGEANGDAKLKKEQVYAIREDPRAHREIAADYGVSRTQVSRIKKRERWAHLPEQAAR